MVASFIVGFNLHRALLESQSYNQRGRCDHLLALQHRARLFEARPGHRAGFLALKTISKPACQGNPIEVSLLAASPVLQRSLLVSPRGGLLHHHGLHVHNALRLVAVVASSFVASVVAGPAAEAARGAAHPAEAVAEVEAAAHGRWLAWWLSW